VGSGSDRPHSRQTKLLTEKGTIVLADFANSFLLESAIEETSWQI